MGNENFPICYYSPPILKNMRKFLFFYLLGFLSSFTYSLVAEILRNENILVSIFMCSLYGGGIFIIILFLLNFKLLMK